tara:strand:+ start:105 stop:278 length:174 start_codon:yes stop_codon:yes gene_type:complete
MNITSAQYANDHNDNLHAIIAIIDGVTVDVPIAEDNRHYAEILKQVADGDLTIADAD